MAEALAGVDHAAFVAANTSLIAPPLVPELRLHLASEISPLWQLTEDELTARGLPPPYWAFAWAGGQALARHILDHRALVTGRAVLDFGSGSGLVAIAAALAGASHVTATDIDPFAVAAIALNARANGVEIAVAEADVIGSSATRIDVMLAGDIAYERPFADAALGWLEGLAREGTRVLVGDPGRAYLPRERLERVAEYRVEATGELEDADVRRTGVWRFRPDGAATGRAATGRL